MPKITISIDGSPAQTFDYNPSGAGAAPAPSNANFPVIDTWTGPGPNKITSDEFPAGSGFAIAIDVAADQSFAASVDIGQWGPRGGAFKDAVISGTPGNMTGITLALDANTVSAGVGFNYPAAGINLTPGRHYLNVLFRNLGAAAVTRGQPV